MFGNDPLHQIEQGNAGKHIWPWMLESILSSEAQDILDEKYVENDIKLFLLK